jgi:hypothetical protein
MEFPTVVVVGTNEPRSSSKSPTANLSLGSGKIGLEAHHQKPTMSVDEVDSPRGPIVPEIKVSANLSKPEIIPRAKSKVTNVKKAPPPGSDSMAMPQPLVVEAISPVVKMSADFEKMVEEHSISDSRQLSDFDMNMKIKDPKPTIIDVEPVDQLHLHEKMPSMLMGESHEMAEVRSSHVEIAMTAPELGLDMSHVEKPQRGRKKEKVDKNKEKEAKKEKQQQEKEMKDKDAAAAEGGEQSPEKSKSGKFGFHLPDISLNFGKGSNKSEDKDKDKTKEEGEDGEKMIKEKVEKDKKDKKGKDKENKEKDVVVETYTEIETIETTEISTADQPQPQPDKKATGKILLFRLWLSP